MYLFAVTLICAVSQIHVHVSEEFDGANSVLALASVEKREFSIAEPIWVKIEFINRTETPFLVLKNVNPYGFLKMKCVLGGNPVEELRFLARVRAARYSFDRDHDEAVEVKEVYLPDVIPLMSEEIRSGEKHVFQILANLTHDLSASGTYTLHYGVPYNFKDEEGHLKSDIAWVKPLTVTILDQLPSPPEEQ